MATSSITIGDVGNARGRRRARCWCGCRAPRCAAPTPSSWLKGAEFTPGHEIFGVVEQPGPPRCTASAARSTSRFIAATATPAGAATRRCASNDIGAGRLEPPGRLCRIPDRCPSNACCRCRTTSRTTSRRCCSTPSARRRTASASSCRWCRRTTAGRCWSPAPAGRASGVVLALQNLGYADVHVSDLKEERLAARRVLRRASAIRSATPSKRFELIVECSGAHAARTLGMEIVLPRGALILIGESDAPWPVQENKAIRRKDFYMVRTFYFPIERFRARTSSCCARDKARLSRPGRCAVRHRAAARDVRPLRRRRAGQAPAGFAWSRRCMASISIRKPGQALRRRHRRSPISTSRSTTSEFVVFVGPSGCGKSTLLRIIAGLEPIDGGELYIGDKRVNDVPPAQRDIAMVFQDYALYPHMTRLRQHGLRPRTARHAQGRDRRAACSARRRCCTSSPISTASPRRCRAASASASPWAARSCATRRCSCSTSRCPTSTPSCAARCAPRSRRCRSSSRPRWSSSPTTRSRP